MKSTLPILLATHLLAGTIGVGIGMYVYRMLTVEDESYTQAIEEERQAREQRDRVLEQSVSESESSGEPLSGTSSFTVQGGGMSNVTFTSDAPLEKIVGNTSRTFGSLSVDLGDIAKTTGSVTIDMASLKTGIDVRDEHMAEEEWLDSKNHPQATFTLERVEHDGKPLFLGQTKSATIHGTLDFRGTKKTKSIEVGISYYPWTEKFGEIYVAGDVLRIDGGFELTLSEFGINTPENLSGQKIAEEVQIVLSLSAVTDEPTKR